MNKQFKKIIASCFALTLCMNMTLSASAVGSNYEQTISGTKETHFDKYLVMDNDTRVPDVEFSYSIVPGQPVSYNTATGKFEILAGVGNPTITWDWYKGKSTADTSDDVTSTVVFAPGDATYTNTSERYKQDKVKGLDDSEKYARHVATIDFSNVIFPEPGVYRYIITEDNPTKQGIVYDTNLIRVLDVYVNDISSNTEKKLEIEQYVLQSTVEDISSDTDVGGSYGTTGSYSDTNSKSQGFTNEYITHDLTFSKTVTGNQASRDKYFAFTVEITGALPNTIYDIDLSNADATTKTNAATIADNANKVNPSTIITDANGNVTQVFYLQHDQSITINGLTDETKWVITENKEDYLPAIEVQGFDGDAAADSTNKARASDTNTGIKDDTALVYTNTRNGTVPTGVILAVAPFAALTVIGAGGLIFVLKKKKKSDE